MSLQVVYMFYKSFKHANYSSIHALLLIYASQIVFKTYNGSEVELGS